MTTTVLGDLMFPNEKYMKDGVEKTKWLNCGVVLQTDKGIRVKMSCLPIDMQQGWFSVFEPRSDSQSQNGQQAQSGGFRDQKPVDPKDDIPF